MARKPKFYQKLVPRRGGVGTYFSLWLGPDHVLQVEANMMTERYQRVFLRDVEGFLTRPSRQSRWVTGVSLGFLVMFALIGLFVKGAEIPCWVCASLMLIVLFYGVFGARDCHFHIVTAVQQSEWPNVARRRRARKLVARLEPLIIEAQRAGGEGGVTAAGAPDVSENA